MTSLSAARAALDAEAKRLKAIALTDLFAADSNRVDKWTLQAPRLIADFSKQRVDDGALKALSDLAVAADFNGWRAKMFAGEIINPTENRPAMHWALRGPDAPDGV
jgi:glucose-6-phosphate isomerase